MDIPNAEILIEHSRRRYYRDDAVRWVWIVYGLAQAVVTMLMAFNVVESITVPAVVTAVALIIYVGVNEIFVRPYRVRMSQEFPQSEIPELTIVDQPDTTVAGSTLPATNSTP